MGNGPTWRLRDCPRQVSFDSSSDDDVSSQRALRFAPLTSVRVELEFSDIEGQFSSSSDDLAAR